MRLSLSRLLLAALGLSALGAGLWLLPRAPSPVGAASLPSAPSRARSFDMDLSAQGGIAALEMTYGFSFRGKVLAGTEARERAVVSSGELRYASGNVPAQAAQEVLKASFPLALGYFPSSQGFATQVFVWDRTRTPLSAPTQELSDNFARTAGAWMALALRRPVPSESEAPVRFPWGLRSLAYSELKRERGESVITLTTSGTGSEKESVHGEFRIALAADGEVRSFSGKESVRVDIGQGRGLATEQTFSLMPGTAQWDAEAAERIWPGFFRAGFSVKGRELGLSLENRASDAGVLPALADKEVGEAIFHEFDEAAQRWTREPEGESTTTLWKRLRELLKKDPDAAEIFARKIRERGASAPGFLFSIGLLQHVATPEAQRALLELLENFSSERVPTLQLLTALGTSGPAPDDVRQDLEAFARSHDAEVARGAELMLANLDRLSGTHSGLVSRLLLNKSGDVAHLLLVLGNSGLTEGLPIAETLLRGKTAPELRAQALMALRFIDSPRAEDLLGEGLTMGPQERDAALSALEMRRSQGPWTQRLRASLQGILRDWRPLADGTAFEAQKQRLQSLVAEEKAALP